jgi:DNA-binding MarR family transcriptional regulator
MWKERRGPIEVRWGGYRPIQSERPKKKSAGHLENVCRLDGHGAHHVRLLQRAIHTILKEGHLRLIAELGANPLKRVDTGHLSRSTGIPYTTTKRYLKELCMMGAVRRGGHPSESRYFELTETGELLAAGSTGDALLRPPVITSD